MTSVVGRFVMGEQVRGFDTGCADGSALTPWIAEEDPFVQVSDAP